jgi:hypothetical protein
MSHPSRVCFTGHWLFSEPELALTSLEMLRCLVVHVQLEKRLAQEEVGLDRRGVDVQRSPAITPDLFPLARLHVAQGPVRQVRRAVWAFLLQKQIKNSTKIDPFRKEQWLAMIVLKLTIALEYCLTASSYFLARKSLFPSFFNSSADGSWPVGDFESLGFDFMTTDSRELHS